MNEDKLTTMELSSGKNCELSFSSENGEQYFFFANGYSPLSNYHMTSFSVDGIRYRSMEQYLWAQKALLAKDYQAYQNIMDEMCSKNYKYIRINGLNYGKWDSIHKTILLGGLHEKFSQNLKARTRLLSTGNAKIVHTTARDRIYGSGLEIGDTNNMDCSKWEGLNVLGELLMIVRNNICDV